jgi:hypothetical protein
MPRVSVLERERPTGKLVGEQIAGRLVSEPGAFDVNFLLLDWTFDSFLAGWFELLLGFILGRFLCCFLFYKSFNLGKFCGFLGF